MFALVVINAFGPYATGAHITDADLVAEHRESPNVVAVDMPDAAPEAQPAQQT